MTWGCSNTSRTRRRGSWENPDAKNVLDNLENVPTVKEIQRAIGRTKSEKAAGDNGIPAEYYQALASSEEGLEQNAQVIAESWQGTNFEEWKLSRLKILPKKGDLSDPNNWRPIMLLDVLQKIMSSLIAQRLEIVDIEEQYGFPRGQTGLPRLRRQRMRSATLKRKAGSFS